MLLLVPFDALTQLAGR